DLEGFARALSETGVPMSGLSPGDVARLAADRGGTPLESDAGEESISIKLAPQPPGLYRRFVQRAQVGGLLVDHLAVGEPYLALSPLVLDRESDDQLRHLTSVFAGIFDRAARELAADVSTLEAMGFPWVAAELLRAEQPRTPILGRFD